MEVLLNLDPSEIGETEDRNTAARLSSEKQETKSMITGANAEDLIGMNLLIFVTVVAGYG